MMYYQCELNSDGKKTVSWIEERGAKVGRSFRLTDSPDPDLYWTVQQVYQPGMDEHLFKERQLLQRKWHNNI